jgi:pimeloyl-ACP methyl ester carboxylesterase
VAGATPPGTTRRTIATNGINLSVLEAGAPGPGDPTRPLVVLCHGFPELAYSWRHQFAAVASAGWHVVAPDQRGYGDSDCPDEVTDYDIDHLTDDVAGLIAALGHNSAVVVGHDWGAMVAWALAQRIPEVVTAVAGLSVPLVPRPSGPPIEILQAAFAGQFFYMVYFQQPGVADADLGADPAVTVRRFFAGVSTTTGADSLGDLFGPDDGRGMVERMGDPAELPDWLDQRDLDVYADAFARTGFTGPVNWYRNMDRNWHLGEPWAQRSVDVPSLFIAGGADPVLVMSPPSVMDGLVTDLRGTVIVDGAGHWVQQQAPADVNAALTDFLSHL